MLLEGYQKVVYNVYLNQPLLRWVLTCWLPPPLLSWIRLASEEPDGAPRVFCTSWPFTVTLFCPFP